jgi:flagellar motor switch protein FliM
MMNSKEKNIQSFTFKRPDLISKQQMRSLELLHERFARNFSSSISAYLRTGVEVSLESSEQVSYSDFLKSAADPTCYAAISAKPLDGLVAVEFTPQIVFPMIDRLLGGTGQELRTLRPMTEIEQNIMQRILKLLTDNLKESWRPLCEIDFAAGAMETHPGMLQVVQAGEMVVHFGFQVRMRQTIAKMRLAFPTQVLAPIVHIFDQESYSRKRNMQEGPVLQLRNVPVNVTVETAATPFPIQSLLSLQIGDTLVLDQRHEWPVQLKVAGHDKLQAVPQSHSSKKRFVVSGPSRPIREETIHGSISQAD